VKVNLNKGGTVNKDNTPRDNLNKNETIMKSDKILNDLLGKDKPFSSF
jgi:hypothetical protein